MRASQQGIADPDLVERLNDEVPAGHGVLRALRSWAIWVVACYALLGMFASAAAEDVTVLIGTHVSGPGKGFSVAHFDTATGLLTKPTLLTEASAPAYFIIAPDGRRLYTCNSPGFVSAYAIENSAGKLRFLNQQPSGGGDPSYISMDKTSHYVFVANYQGGSIAAWALKPDGSLGERTAYIQQTGSSIDPQRQTHAYAHSIVIDPSNRFALVADLGTDRLYVYRFNVKDGSLTPNDPAFVKVTPGSGPRHVVFHPNGRFVYLVTEMGDTVIFFHWDGQRGVLTEQQSISTLPPEFHGISVSAEIKVHPNGRFLYTSNRGRDSIAVFSINAESGRLTRIQDVPSGGRWPRNFDFDPTGHWMLVTNHESNNAAVLRLDPQTGLLTPVGQPVEVPFPFCPRFLETQP
jgi:6-phosphogluconolactonase